MYGLFGHLKRPWSRIRRLILKSRCHPYYIDPRGCHPYYIDRFIYAISASVENDYKPDNTVIYSSWVIHQKPNIYYYK